MKYWCFLMSFLKIDKKDLINILTFGIVFPFELVGFLVKVSKVLTDEKIPIFTIFAYSAAPGKTLGK